MSQRQLFKYTLMDILRSDVFFKRLMTAAELTKGGYESALWVYGNRRKYRITRAFKGERDCIPTEIVDTAYKDIPEDFKFRIINLHFHPPANIAIPSESDFIMGDETPSGFDLVDEYDDHNDHEIAIPITYVVGRRSDTEEITLFFKQGTEKHIRELMEDRTRLRSFNEYISDLLRADLAGKHERLRYDPADKTLPRRAAEILKSTGRYNAEAINFSNRETYERELERLATFTLFIEI